MSDAQLYGTTDALPPLRWRLVSWLAGLAAFAVLALVLAQWAWQWFGPSPVSIPVTSPAGDFGRRIADAHLFGSAAPAPSTAVAPATGDLRLLGVIAERDGHGYALFRSGSRGPLLVVAGQEVGAGVRLDAVRANSVTLVEGGVRRDIPLRAAASPPVARVGRGPQPVVATAARASACAPPAGFAGPIVRLNAELLGGMMTTTDAWKALVEPGAGALIVRDQSGFAGNLGLKNGDRVDSANGVALAVPADIPAMVLQPLTRSQPVWLAGSRDGKPQHWLYLNAGACPG